MDNLQVNLATIGDYESYYAIRSEKTNLFWTGYTNAPNHTTFKPWFIGRIHDQEKQLYLLFQENNCLGSLNVDYYSNYAFIGYSVIKQFEKKGLGSNLVKNAISLITEQPSIKTIKAWVNFQNIGSIRVLEKNGFEKSGITELRTRFGEDEEYILFILNL